MEYNRSMLMARLARVRNRYGTDTAGATTYLTGRGTTGLSSREADHVPPVRLPAHTNGRLRGNSGRHSWFVAFEQTELW